MIPLVGSGIRRISACLESRISNRFSVDEIHGNLNHEALPSITRSASNCQNRYPSPSGWSGPNPRVRPSYPFLFERPVADDGCLTQISLVEPHSCNVFVSQGHGALQIRGKQTCRRDFLSLWRLRFWVWRVATPGAISNARSSAERSDAPQVKSTKMASASPEQLSAQRLALSQTTSDHAPIGRQLGSTGLSRHFAEQPFLIAVPGTPGNRRGQCSRRS